MRTDPLPHLVLVGLSILSVAGCTIAGKEAPATPSTGPIASTARPAATPTAPDRTPMPDEAGKAWLLVGRTGEADLHVVLSTTSEEMMAVPDGAPSTNWRRVVTATVDGASTVVRDLDVASGGDGPSLRVDGHWHLPTVALDPVPAGRSLDGSTIALVEGTYDPAAGRSRIAIVDHYLLDAVQTSGDAPLRLVRIIELKGAFEYDTLSPDGRVLYVIQHLDAEAGGHYQVRAVDVDTGKLRDDVIVDKGNPDERMAGSPIAQVRRADGVVMTLYRGPEHPFIHLLQSTEGWAFCIDLPAGAADDTAAGLDWGLTPSPDGSAVFAVNASLGLAVDVDPNGLAIRRTASIGTTAGLPIALAKFGHGDMALAGRRLVASGDGTMLFAAGTNGVTVIRTKDLATLRQDLAGLTVDAIGLTPDGRTLFALLRDGTIIARDAATGRDLGTVPGRGYDRLLAVAPW